MFGVDPQLFHRGPVPSDAALKLRWLGAAGFELQLAQQTILLDPFLTRTGLLRTGVRRLRPDRQLIRRHLPRADQVLVGHAHYDHALDAPEVCRQTGARLIGSRSVCNVGRAYGLPEEQLVETQGGEDIDCDGVTVHGMKSEHGRVYFGRVTLPGNIHEPPTWPPRVFDMKHGQVLNWYVEGDGLRVIHIDSAEFYASELHGRTCDVLCLCAIGRAWRDRYVEEAIELMQPRVVVACHWDWFFRPLSRPMWPLPGVDLQGFVAEIEACGVRAVVLDALQPYGLARA